MAASRAGRRRWSPRAHSLPAGHTIGLLPPGRCGLPCRLPLSPLPRGARGGVGSRPNRRRRMTLLQRCGRTSAASATITASIRATARRAGRGMGGIGHTRSARVPPLASTILCSQKDTGPEHLAVPGPVVNQRSVPRSIRPRARHADAVARSSPASRRRAKGRSNQWRGRFRGLGPARRSTSLSGPCRHRPS